MRIVFAIWACLYCALALAGDGVPFFTNYTAAVYGAHNRNFDVVAGADGMVFFANFEGLLYYDQDRWHILHTPGYSRVTHLLKDSRGTVWAAGYNFLAGVETDERRSVRLRTVISDSGNGSIGEVTELAEDNGRIRIRNRKGETFVVEGNGFKRLAARQTEGAREARPAKVHVDRLGEVEINDRVTLACGWTVLATCQDGIVVTDKSGQMIYAVSEADGLCSNSINGLADSGNGCVWGVTDNGICCVYVPSMFTRYAAEQGLKGEVTTMQRYGGKLYVGTLQGLYRTEGKTLQPVRGISQACWKLQLSADGGTLYAATTEGVFRIRKDGIRRLTQEYAQTLCCDGNSLYVAGIDGLWRLSTETGKCVRIADIEKVTSLERDRNGDIVARDIEGRLYRKRQDDSHFRQAGKARTDGCFFTDADGSVRWLTDLEGKEISCISAWGTYPADELDTRLLPLRDWTVRTLLADNDTALWIGGEYGVVRTDFRAGDAAFSHPPQVYIREVRIDRDSLLFGGVFYADEWDGQGANRTPPVFGFRTKEVTFRYSADMTAVPGKNCYQYMLQGYDDGWSAWTEETEKSYANLFYGSYSFMVRAQDAFGRISSPKVYRFSIAWPFYLQWYSVAAYVLLFALSVYLCIKWRLRALIREKERLEEIVVTRTLQIQGQKEEIERKSANLEKALSDLRHAQEDLLRQEKMAAIGKLTRGLIDRILNPLNYINNFSHLSAGLTRELRRNLQKAENRISAEEYEDSADLLDMLSANLDKIEWHGGSTSRILKAMEEILKEGSSKKQRMDLVGLCRRAGGLLHEYYRDEINRMGVAVRLNVPDTGIYVEGNEEQLCKTLMSLVKNSMYAIARKYDCQPYLPQVCLELSAGDGRAYIRLRDNGTGIEQPIMGQVFDPFFTTKTTGEAAGVGLYLSREIIVAHGGSITVTSCKNEYTEFIIELPTINKK